jgi:hypothetical protein
MPARSAALILALAASARPAAAVEPPPKLPDAPPQSRVPRFGRTGRAADGRDETFTGKGTLGLGSGLGSAPPLEWA